MKSSYVFGAAMAAAVLGSFGGLEKAEAATVAGFTFETDTTFFPSSGTGSATSGTFFNYSAYTAASVGPLIAQSGTGSAYGVHAASGTAYSTPVGNGSPRAFSANNWGAGDYFQFNVDTTGYTDLLIGFDQVRSSTGPSSFSLLYSTDGVNFSTAGTYSVVSTPSFAASASGTAQAISFDLSAVDALEGITGVVFRLANNASVATGGTTRIDNFIVSGTAAVPEPAALSLVTVAAAGLLGRRKR